MASDNRGLPQEVVVMGGPGLDPKAGAELERGPVKLVVTDHRLPELDGTGWRLFVPGALLPLVDAIPPVAGKVGAETAMVHAGTTRDNPDYYALVVMNEIFGGGFSGGGSDFSTFLVLVSCEADPQAPAARARATTASPGLTASITPAAIRIVSADCRMKIRP